ncbi:MAG TPA: hypothetical protein DCG75_16640 [Bacteroidales bacterium]|jgi:uncharacterized protein with HEPN domain|nr:hypothetical protein [Bacteroidales bacterium]
MELKINKYLFDIQTAIDSIYEYLGENRNFNDYNENKILRRAVERELEIIGEASNRILKIDDQFPIDNARKIIDLRNWVIHGYDKVDNVIIWGVLMNHLPKLKKQVDSLLK